MTNVHMQEAARNIRRAISDIDLKLHQIKNETDQRVHEIETRLNEIKAEQVRSAAMISQAENDITRSRNQDQIRELEREADQLKREIFSVNDEFRKQQSDLNDQMTEFQNLAGRLETAA